jgi:hypothetical protein
MLFASPHRPRGLDLLATPSLLACLALTATVGCGDDGDSTGTSTGSAAASTTSGAGGAGTTGSASSTASTGAAGGAGGAGGGAGSCLDAGYAAGERYPVGDDCNFCDCNADGSTTCTARTCASNPGGCTYDGVDHAYAERFPATDQCNECVCAASGLACTRRDCTTLEEGAILVETLDTPCGTDPNFTAQAVLDGLPTDDLTAPFVYNTAGNLYPETLPNTTVRVRVVYEGGFAVCRIPAPGQEAFDLEVVAEWITADGAFDEGLHTYLRRNAGGFTDAWYLAASAPFGGLDGTYNPACLDPMGFAFGATFDANGTVTGSVDKVCETDIGLTVGGFAYP